MTVLLAPFAYEFFRHGLLASVLSGALCGLMGVPIVLKRMSYIGHGLSHAIFGGAVVSYVLGINFYLGAGAWGFVAAWLIHRTTTRQKIGADAAIGVVTTASFAIGVALISRVRHFTRNFDAALFGNVLGVSGTDLWVVSGVFCLCLILTLVGYRWLLFTLFDTEVAACSGVNTELVQTLLSLLMAATLIATMQIMGVTLIAAALIIPAITARMLTNSFAHMLVLSPVIGACCGFWGMYVSWFLQISSGASIVLLSALVFVGVLMVRGRRATLLPRIESASPGPHPLTAETA